MSGKKKPSKAKISISKPDLPPFLQRMKEQIVANEDADRKQQSERKRKDRVENPDDDPTVVKIDDEDLTEEEYKRMKLEMELQYKLDEDAAKVGPVELDVDDLIRNRKDVTKVGEARTSNCSSSQQHERPSSERATGSSKATSRNLSYDSSSESD